MTPNAPRLSLATDIDRSLHRTLTFLLVLIGIAAPAAAQAQTPAAPSVTLAPAPAITLPGGVDSNSPAVWELVDGVETLQVVTSTAGQPKLASGPRLARLGPASPVTFVTHPGDGVWMESVVADEGGTWYGYYHNEVPAAMCDRPNLTLPRIGAARSRDRGETWDDLGIILEAPPGWHDCATPNQYFVGGVGDVSVVLDRDSKDLYLYFSQYSKYPAAQGVALARIAWAQPWHDDDPRDDAFWGASVHWNVSLQLYVMLLNRTKDEQFTQEGIYASFASRLDDPAAWTTPMKIMDGGSWYPQVIGIETGEGSDKQAGARARLFLGGRSSQFIQFNAR